MKFTYIYFIGLGLLFALGGVSLFFSYKRFEKENRSFYSSFRKWRKSRRSTKKIVSLWLIDLFVDLRGELIGAFITTLLFGLLVAVAQSSQQEQNEKMLLISQLGSENGNITLSASEELLARGWLRDGTLRDTSFIGANLQGLFLKQADMEGSLFNWANMKGASLISANLKNTNFFAADLCGAVLFGADLQQATMMSADLREASFVEANLKGTDLFQSNLQGASFMWAIFDEETILPDGSRLDFDRSLLEQLDKFTKTDGDFDSPNCKQYRPTDLPR